MNPDLALVLALNNRHEVETSRLTSERLAALWRMAYLATAIDDETACAAFLIAFDQDAAYEGAHFHWFKARHPRFVYVDRIVTAAAARGRGLATSLYETLFARMRADGHAIIGCEVNLDPPNPISDRFHARLGFEEVGRAELGGKTVRYCERVL